MAHGIVRGTRKKLIEAARWFARGGHDKSDAHEDLKAFGLLVESSDEPESFDLYEENVDAVDAFLAASTQWKFNAAGQAIGLDYQGVQSLLSLYEIENKKQVFLDMQIMERAVLRELKNG